MGYSITDLSNSDLPQNQSLAGGIRAESNTFSRSLSTMQVQLFRIPHFFSGYYHYQVSASKCILQQGNERKSPLFIAVLWIYHIDGILAKKCVY